MGMVQTSVYSEYSLLQSANRIDQLVSTAKELGYQALALTDHHVMYGSIPFYQSCLKHGIKPLLGLEVTVAESRDDGEEQFFTLRLIAKSNAGYTELLHLATMIGMKNDKQAFVEKQEWLEASINHCAVIIPYKQGAVYGYIQSDQKEKAIQWLRTWKSGELSWYLELQHDEDTTFQRQLDQFSKEQNVPLIAAKPIRYMRNEDQYSYQLLQAIATEKGLNELNHPDFCLPTPEEMESLFHSFPQTLKESEMLADSTHIELDLTVQLPKYPVTDQSATSYLRTLCENGLQQRYSERNEEIQKRLDYELSVIEQMGFSDYFLIVWDFMKYARNQGIIAGPGRGSAAGSIVAYCLYITHVDPLAYNLLFERFLNPERVSLPDIDIDFPDHRRDEVIEYVQGRYGEDRVAQIITFGTFAAKAAIRASAKVLGTEPNLLERIVREIPSTPKITIVQAIEQSKALQQLIQDQSAVENLIKSAQSIEGLPRHTSTHAAGVIISAEPLTERVALEQGRAKIPLTQAPMDVVQQVGLLKFDFLGLRNLTLLETILASINKQENKSLKISRFPLEDKATYKLLASGDTTGVFQLESDGMRNVLARLGPTEFEDIVAVNALYRPGPMDYIPTYIEGKHKKRTVTYLHADVESILSPTYGVLVYQEQIMQLASKLAGFSMAEADLLRRAISKKNQSDLHEQKKDFVIRSTELGYDRSVAEHAYGLIERFANYGFNRSHAVAYSLLSYQLAYLKTHYPSAFYTALLSSVWHNQERLSFYLKEAKQHKQVILPPSISNSQHLFTYGSDGIRFGLLSIEHVGVKAVQEILRERTRKPFTHLFDFCTRLNAQLVPKRTVESLIKAGVFDEWEIERSVLLRSLDEAFEYGKSVREFQAETEGLFTLNPKPPSYLDAEPLLATEKLMYEKQALGFYLSGHPVEEYKEVLQTYDRISLEEAYSHKGKVRIACLVEDSRRITTKKGDPMAFLKIGDESSQCEATVFPKVWKESGHFLKPNHLVFLEGRMDDSRDTTQFLVDRAVPLDKLQDRARMKTLFIRVSSQSDLLVQVKDLLLQSNGSTDVILFFYDVDERRKMPENYRIDASGPVIGSLKGLLGEENVVLR
ncbi:DNA polymerase III subunit alpha [Alkalicoccobacillus murimartini]|uniref:DNA-directed DNA polymerase n=1 Tax=Alkalicoccobacillus murimartini TaxID=171685 RepID=A0ABT9YJS3_9BACI|nr:DNA polymerase III subunit alpha [Alkalicoccobacillus murimartini]MDQ0208105.1 DNA polymerase-3 subunit alpha [Alkalicoccobacillus murimartini]